MICDENVPQTMLHSQKLESRKGKAYDLDRWSLRVGIDHLYS